MTDDTVSQLADFQRRKIVQKFCTVAPPPLRQFPGNCTEHAASRIISSAADKKGEPIRTPPPACVSIYIYGKPPKTFYGFEKIFHRSF